MKTSERSLKNWLILFVILFGLLGFLAWSQPWFVVQIASRGSETLALDVAGATAAPALAALSLAQLALSAALAISGPVVRTVASFLEFLLGFSVALTGINAITQPVLASAATVTDHTGISGVESVRELVQTVTPTVWPTFCIIVGIFCAITAVLLFFTVRHWPTAGRRYQPVRFVDDAGNQTSIIDTWDTLTQGKDPTQG